MSVRKAFFLGILAASGVCAGLFIIAGVVLAALDDDEETPGSASLATPTPTVTLPSPISASLATSAPLPTPSPTMEVLPTSTHPSMPTPTPELSPTLLPTQIPTATLTPTPPESTSLPAGLRPISYCEEWEALVRDYIKRGGLYDRNDLRNMPDHPYLDATQGNEFCITNFPIGQLGWGTAETPVGTGEGELLPGTYRYYDQNRGERVSERHCNLTLNNDDYSVRSTIDLAYGEPFEFTAEPSHGPLWFFCSNSWLVRIGD